MSRIRASRQSDDHAEGRETRGRICRFPAVSTNPAPLPLAQGPGSGQSGPPTRFWRAIAAALVVIVGLLALLSAGVEWIGVAVGVALAAGLRAFFVDDTPS